MLVQKTCGPLFCKGHFFGYFPYSPGWNTFWETNMLLEPWKTRCPIKEKEAITAFQVIWNSFINSFLIIVLGERFRVRNGMLQQHVNCLGGIDQLCLHWGSTSSRSCTKSFCRRLCSGVPLRRSASKEILFSNSALMFEAPQPAQGHPWGRAARTRPTQKLHVCWNNGTAKRPCWTPQVPSDRHVCGGIKMVVLHCFSALSPWNLS